MKRVALFCALSAWVVACDGGEQSKKGGKSGAAAIASTTAAATSTGTGTTTATATDNSDDTALLSDGLPEGCEHKAQGTKMCFTCTPRDLPITRCDTLTRKDFDVNHHCKSTDKKIECDLGNKKAFVFDLTKKTTIEGIYEKLPLILVAGKFFINQKLAQKPADRDALLAVFDLIDTHKKAIFTCGDTSQLVTDLVAAAKTAKPNETPAKMQSFEQGLNAGFGVLKATCAQGGIDDTKLFETVTTLMTTYPGAGEALGVGKVDLQAILGVLGGGSSEGVDFDKLIGDLLNKTGTKTATSTATATSTGT